MKSPENKPNNQIARRYVGYFIDGDYKEVIQVEYRYEQTIGFVLRTRIRNKKYEFQSERYFDALSKLLDQLPMISRIVLLHRVIVVSKDSHTISDLEELLYPYNIRDSGTVVYKLRLYINQNHIETQKHLDFGRAAEDLRTQLEPNYKLQVCYFCEFLVDHNQFGGTDYRHDQIYCFRDYPDDFVSLMNFSPKFFGKESLLSGTQNMDALHSCEAFNYRAEPRL